MSIADTISRPYAQAIFNTAIENNSIDDWKHILIFLNTITSYKKIKNFLSGSLSPKYLSLVFITIANGIIDEKAKNLIRLLCENQRLKILNNILEQFLRLEASYKNTMIVELKSAFSLKARQLSKIRKILEASLSKKIKLICSTDPRIINGLIIKINDTVFNLSVQNYLKQLSDALNF